MNDFREVSLNPNDSVESLISKYVPSFDQAFERWLSSGASVIQYGSSSKPKRFGSRSEKPQQIRSLRELDSRTQLFEYLGRYRQIDQRGNAVFNEKDGGKVYFNREGLVINEADARSAQLWVTIAKGLPDIADLLAHGSSDKLTFLPVAPVLTDKSGRPRVVEKGEKFRVFSRFSGLNAAFIADTLGEAKNKCRELSVAKPAAKIVEERIDSLIGEINTKYQNALTTLTNAGLIHSGHELYRHSHFANITVEFTKKSAYERMMNEGTINTHFDPEETHFDVAKYLANPEEYEAVVRLIDFDHIRMRPFELPGIEKPASFEAVEQLIQSQSYYERMVGLEAFGRSNAPLEDQFLVKVFRTATNDKYLSSRIAQRIAEMDRWPDEIENDLYTMMCEAEGDKLRSVYSIFKYKPWSAKFKSRVTEGLKMGSIKPDTILWVLPRDQEFERQNKLLERVLSTNDESGIRNGVFWVSDLIGTLIIENHDGEMPYKDFLVSAASSRDERAASQSFAALSTIVEYDGDEELVNLAKVLSKRFLPVLKKFRSNDFYGFSSRDIQDAAVKFISSIKEP